MIVYVNGTYLPEEEAVISVFDRGFLYGDTVYETVRAHGGNLLFWDGHTRRLRRSLELAAFEPDHRLNDLTAVTAELLRRNHLSDARLRITISRGAGGPDQIDGFQHTWVVTARPFKPLPEARYEQGIAAVLVGVARNDRGALDPEIKSGNFLNNILARREARLRGADEGIMLSSSGLVAEGSMSNLFWVAGGALETPALDIGLLPGITRAKVLELARASLGQAGMDAAMGTARRESSLRALPDGPIPGLRAVREVRAPVDRLRGAEEIFVTSTSFEVMPVTRWEEQPVGVGTRGPVARLLRERLRLLY